MKNIMTTFLSAIIQNGKRILTLNRYGKHDPVSPVEIAPFGIDSQPLPNAQAAMGETASGTHPGVCYGYVNNNQEAGPGETRIYSTDGDGNVIATVYLHGNGQVNISNNNCNITIFSDGTINSSFAGGVAINTDSSGDVSITSTRLFLCNPGPAPTNHAVQFEALNNNLQLMLAAINTQFTDVATTLGTLTGAAFGIPYVPVSATLDLHDAIENNIFVY